MALTQDQIAANLIAQLRLLDPSVSAEVGTPERKILDTVAEAIAEDQIDLNLLSGALDLDAKSGSDLDAFVGLFGFGRQQGSFATGFITFSRDTPSPYPITIGNGTQINGTTTITSGSVSVTFQTTTAVTLATGQTSVIAPIQALLPGSFADLAANTITEFANLGAPPLGITGVTNEVPTSNGSDIESDAELKVRFKNTVFRNLAGTEDQYLALAAATLFSTKANVVGPLSRYQEYIQVPSADDSQVEGPVVAVLGTATTNTDQLTGVMVISGGTPQIGNYIFSPYLAEGTTILDMESGTWTLSQSFTGPAGTYSFTVITDEPADGAGGGTSGQYTTVPSNNPHAKYIYYQIPHFVSTGSVGLNVTFYRQDTDFVLNAPPLNAGDTYREVTENPPDIPDPVTTPYQPNVTFFNVYTGPDDDVVQPRPGDVLLLEYAYLSKVSRNDIPRGITNCVDVYVNGENLTTTDAVIAPPGDVYAVFNEVATDKFYRFNFRRIGEPDVPPSAGNLFTALFWQPVTDVPDTITAGDNIYVKGRHYWGVEDISLLGNTVRSRNGLEWDPTALGDTVGGENTGTAITSPGVTGVTVSGYTYDTNIVDLQAALDGAKQITTDALAHRATPRYLKCDITLVYSPGSSVSATNQLISDAVDTLLRNQYFGATIQLADLIATVRSVRGVANARWSNDVLNLSDDSANAIARVTETDVSGNPRDSVITATPLVPTNNSLSSVSVLTGIPQPGWVITGLDNTGLPAMTRVLSLNAAYWTLSGNFTSGAGTFEFLVTSAWNTDFVLGDNELAMLPTGSAPGDTLPGLILRQRAQNTFNTN